MKQYNYKKDGFTYHRIDKRAAETAYNNGWTIVFCPCNIRPDSSYGLAIDMNIAQTETSFEKLLNNFEYYNCNAETGYYTAFYAAV